MSDEKKKPEMVPNATVTYRHDLHDELSIVHIEPDGGEVPDFTAGQFAMLGLPPDHRAVDAAMNLEEGKKPKLIRRAYSIASSPLEKRHLEFYVTLVSQGKLTSRLWTVDEGDKVWLGPKINGKFTLDPIPEDQDIIMVATGTGIAPFISMTRTYKGTGRWRRLAIIYSARHARDIGYEKELTKLAEEDPTVSFIPTTTREPEDGPWKGFRGRPQDVIKSGELERVMGAKPEPGSSHWLLCGNPAMIEQMDEMLVAEGWKIHKKDDPGNIHYERYW